MSANHTTKKPNRKTSGPGEDGRRANRKRLLTLAVILIAAAGILFAHKGDEIQNRIQSKGIHAEAGVAKAGYKSGGLSPRNLSDKSIRKTVPNYSGQPYRELNGGKPEFRKSEISKKAYERLGDLDRLGRCTGTLACLGREIMPKDGQQRGSISEIHPTGWHSVQYRSVSGGSLYNRCHLIGWQLTGNDAVARNLITGTRYMNVEGMEPFESKVAEYLRSTGNHVMYRVTPVFRGDEAVARGVHMEALSVEDGGRGISFNVYCYNVQPKIKIDYATGESKSTISGDKSGYRTRKNGRTYSAKKLQKHTVKKGQGTKYIVNTNTGKFHYPSCYSVKQMSERNTVTTKESRKQLIAEGYSPCGNCHP